MIIEYPSNDVTEQEKTDSRTYEEMKTDLQDNDKYLFTKYNLTGLYNGLSSESFSNLLWLFKYYDELFDNEDTENLNPNIKTGINNLMQLQSTWDEMEIKEHKIFKNLLFNVKQISFLDETGNYKEMTYSDMQEMFQKENFFTIGKIEIPDSAGNKLKESLDTLGFKTITPSKGIACERHDVGFKYFIFSSEPIELSEYVDLLDQDRTDEEWYENKFDDIGVLPQFNEETDITFTYMQSNYVNQSRDGRMSLKGVNKELSLTETSTNTSVVSVSDTGY